MAVVHYVSQEGVELKRQFHPPARAGDLKYWFKAASKALADKGPAWQDQYASDCHYDVDSIIFECPTFTMTIARKRYMR